MLVLTRRPKLSVVVAVFNMRREAARTLLALTATYQRAVRADDYEVIVVESNSTAPLDQDWVIQLQRNFRYRFVQSSAPTPNRAMNEGISMARGKLVTCLIDGARIPTPLMIRRSLDAYAAFGSSYVMTLGMHLGPKAQNKSIFDGYNQTAEDGLLNSVNWQHDGYRLFTISSLAGSSRGGYFQPIAESNCFTVEKKRLEELNGFDERFTSPGGGLINLHLHNQLISHPALIPVMLLGEATFHQFHGGVATNAKESPFGAFCEEYERLVGRSFEKQWRRPIYFGSVCEAAERFLNLPQEQ